MASSIDADHIADLFSQFGPVSVRRMFGGAGIAADGRTFAIAFDGVIYLKTDDMTRPLFEREGSSPFVYPLAKKPRPRRKPSSFWRLPERLYDDPDELAQWARAALAVARAAKTVRKKAGTRSKPRRGSA